MPKSARYLFQTSTLMAHSFGQFPLLDASSAPSNDAVHSVLLSLGQVGKQICTYLCMYELFHKKPLQQAPNFKMPKSGFSSPAPTHQISKRQIQIPERQMQTPERQIQNLKDNARRSNDRFPNTSPGKNIQVQTLHIQVHAFQYESIR